MSVFNLNILEENSLREIHKNLSTEELYNEIQKRDEGKISKYGSLVVHTGQHTGRAPNDKFIVKEETSENKINWGKINSAISEDGFNKIFKRLCAYLEVKDLYVQELYGGTDLNYRLPVRVITEFAWHSLFAKTLLVNKKENELFETKNIFTIIDAPNFTADPETDGTNSEVFIIINFAKRIVIIGGTSYAGEIKKSVFTILNYLLPQQNVFPMHCSANIGKNLETTIFFGLSGTGKTTLSADANRKLIGDDEHGWSSSGVFNFEGGCYAKVIRLSQTSEPEIFATTRMFGTVLENVIMDPNTKDLDLDDGTLTENTRAGYPLKFIPSHEPSGLGTHPSNIVFLTCDAFGVLPPISKLTKEQAMYHFLSGYTAKVAGTEKGVGKEPQITFSTCFGAPFMPLHPKVYANMLGKKMEEHSTNVWLVNTGWNGGEFGTGSRIKISYTRAIINAALDGKFENVKFETDKFFGLQIPTSCENVPTEILNPRNSWQNKNEYDKKAAELLEKFKKNYEQYL